MTNKPLSNWWLVILPTITFGWRIDVQAIFAPEITATLDSIEVMTKSSGGYNDSLLKRRLSNGN